MTGLSEKELVGCTAILKCMSNEDLLSLSDTVTNKMIVVENIQEAMETILSFSNNADELLRRRKVHRDLIFKYLAKEGVVMPPNSEKHQLVKRTLRLWSSVKVHTETRGQVAWPLHAKGELDESPRGETIAQTTSDTPSLKTEVVFDPQTLGQQFCQWFFQLLNSQNPSLDQNPQDWGPQHFWPDVKLHLLATADSEQMEEFQGAELVSLRLQALTKDEHLHLCPNLESQGLKTLASPHGLVVVAVAGTIHRYASCLGIFEQIFGLIRSPLDNNTWKIKFINLKIRGQDALSGTGATAPTLTYNSSELQHLCSS